MPNHKRNMAKRWCTSKCPAVARLRATKAFWGQKFLWTRSLDSTTFSHLRKIEEFALSFWQLICLSEEERISKNVECPIWPEVFPRWNIVRVLLSILWDTQFEHSVLAVQNSVLGRKQEKLRALVQVYLTLAWHNMPNRSVLQLCMRCFSILCCFFFSFLLENGEHKWWTIRKKCPESWTSIFSSRLAAARSDSACHSACQLSGCLSVAGNPSPPPRTWFLGSSGNFEQLSFLEKKIQDCFFFTQNFSSMSCGWSKVRHKSPSILDVFVVIKLLCLDPDVLFLLQESSSQLASCCCLPFLSVSKDVPVRKKCRHWKTGRVHRPEPFPDLGRPSPLGAACFPQGTLLTSIYEHAPEGTKEPSRHTQVYRKGKSTPIPN